MNYCNVNTKKLINFSLASQEVLNRIYDAFGNQPYTYPIVNSQGYYRRGGIKYWIDNAFPTIPVQIREKATFVLWSAYNKFDSDKPYETAI